MIIKVIGSDIAIDTANTIGNATLVRIYNAGAANNFCNVGSLGFGIRLNKDESVIIEKSATDTVKGTACYAMPVAYKN